MKALLEYIDSKEAEMLEFLETLVNIDSGSYDKACLLYTSPSPRDRS